MAKNSIENITVVTRDYMATNKEHFYIVKFDVDSEYVTGKRYGAINYKDVEKKSGKIAKSMNGHEMYMHETVAEVINDIEYRIKIDETAKAEGISKMAATLLLCPDNHYTKEECVKIAKQFEQTAKEIERKLGAK